MSRPSTSSLKRKLGDPTTSFSPQSRRKIPRVDQRASPSSSNVINGAKNHRQPVVEEEQTETVEDDREAGPELPAEEDNSEDEDGRFFGGGVSEIERQVLDYVEDTEETDEKIDLTWLKRTAVSFERKINKNAELRAKFEDDPIKFVSSEADLDAEIRNLSLLSGHPELYADFVRSGCAESLVGLLAHENTDIAIAACQVIENLIDEDSEVPESDWNLLVTTLLRADLVSLLVSNLYRLDVRKEDDSNGIYHILAIFEGLLSDTDNAAVVSKSTKFLTWLVDRIRTDTKATGESEQNRQYAAELAVILAQNSREAASQFVKLGAVDVFLQLLSIYRSVDPARDSDEEEFLENIWDCLISLTKTAAGAEKLVADEGIELFLIMLREAGWARRGALRVMDHATGSIKGGEIARQIVEAGGLKPLFTFLMKSKKADRDLVEHLLGILSGMLRQLPSGSSQRVRLLAKFMEKDYEKCKRLLELRAEYDTKVSKADQDIAAEREQIDRDEPLSNEAEWLSRRLDAGLFTLQTLDTVLAWIMAEDRGARSKIESQLSDPGVILQSLRTQLHGMDIEVEDVGISSREMLEALIDVL